MHLCILMQVLHFKDESKCQRSTVRAYLYGFKFSSYCLRSKTVVFKARDNFFENGWRHSFAVFLLHCPCSSQRRKPITSKTRTAVSTALTREVAVSRSRVRRSQLSESSARPTVLTGACQVRN